MVNVLFLTHELTKTEINIRKSKRATCQHGAESELLNKTEAYDVAVVKSAKCSIAKK